MAKREVALIVGSGPGLSASLARLFTKEGMQVALAARDTKKLEGLIKEINGRTYPCDASIPKDVDRLFVPGDIRAEPSSATTIENCSAGKRVHAASTRGRKCARSKVFRTTEKRIGCGERRTAATAGIWHDPFP